jgi:hypothetical protein
MYIVYKTINKIDGNFYIGVHKTLKEDFDGYLGSGKILKAAVSKYGRNNFTRLTLYTFDNADSAYAKEAEIVNKDLIKDNACYNCGIGGRGLRQTVENNFRTPEWRARVSASLKGRKTGDSNPARQPGVGAKISAAKKGKPNLKLIGHISANRKKVHTCSGIFESVTAASKHYKVSITTIKDWCRDSRKPSFYFLCETDAPSP